MTKLQAIDTQTSLTHLAERWILHWAQGCYWWFWGREKWQFLSRLLPCCSHRWQSSTWLLLARADKPEKAGVFSGRVKHWNLMWKFQVIILWCCLVVPVGETGFLSPLKGKRYKLDWEKAPGSAGLPESALCAPSVHPCTAHNQRSAPPAPWGVRGY